MKKSDKVDDTNADKMISTLNEYVDVIPKNVTKTEFIKFNKNLIQHLQKYKRYEDMSVDELLSLAKNLTQEYKDDI